MSLHALTSDVDQARPSKRTKVNHTQDEGNGMSGPDDSFWNLPEIRTPSDTGAELFNFHNQQTNVGEAPNNPHLTLVYGESVPSRKLVHTYDEWDNIEYDPPAGQDERRASYVDPTSVSEVRARRRELFAKALENVDRTHLDEFSYLCEKLKGCVEREGKTSKLVLETDALQGFAARLKQLHLQEMSQASKDLAMLFIQCTGPFAPLRTISRTKLVGPVCLAPMLGNISHEALKKANNTICNRVMSAAGANLFRAQRKFSIFGRGASNKEEKEAGIAKKRGHDEIDDNSQTVQQPAAQPGVQLDVDNLQTIVDEWVPQAGLEPQPADPEPQPAGPEPQPADPEPQPAGPEQHPFEQDESAAEEMLRELASFAPERAFAAGQWQGDWMADGDASLGEALGPFYMPSNGTQVQQPSADNQSFDLSGLTDENLAGLAPLDQLPSEQPPCSEPILDNEASEEAIRPAVSPLQENTQGEENQPAACASAAEAVQEELSPFERWLEMCRLPVHDVENFQG